MVTMLNCQMSPHSDRCVSSLPKMSIPYFATELDNKQLPNEITVDRKLSPFAQLQVNAKEKTVVALIVRSSDVMAFLHGESETSQNVANLTTKRMLSYDYSRHDPEQSNKTDDSSAGSTNKDINDPQHIVWLDACWLFEHEAGSHDYHTLLSENVISAKRKPIVSFPCPCDFLLRSLPVKLVTMQFDASSFLRKVRARKRSSNDSSFEKAYHNFTE